MISRMRTRTVVSSSTRTLITLVAVIALAGCSADAPAPAGAPANDDASSSATPTAEVPAAPEVPAQTEGCAWITTDMAAAVLGAPVTSTGPTSGHLAAIDDCNFSTDPTDALPVGSGITYQVIDQGSIESAQAAFASMNVSGGASIGVGDESAETGTSVGSSTIVRFGTVTSVVAITNAKKASEGALSLQKEIGTHLGY